MPMMDWLVGFGVEYEDGGAAEQVKALATNARDASKAFIELQKAADKLTASLGKVATSAGNADRAVSSLAAAFGAAAASGYSASAGADSATSGFRRAATAARSAARDVQAYADAWMAAVASMASAAALGAGTAPSVALGAGGTASYVRSSFASVGGQAALTGTPRLALPAGAGTAIALAGGGGGGGWDYFGPGGDLVPLGAGGALAVPEAPVRRAFSIGGARLIGGRAWGPFFNEMGRNAGQFLGATAAAASPYALKYGKKAAKAGLYAGLGVAGDSLYEAGKLQQELTGIQVATGANTGQMDQIRQAAYDISNMTAQSVAQSAAVIGVMASSGINDPKALLARDPKTGQSFAEIVAKFADVQYLKSHGKVSFEEATKQAIQLAHLHRNYDPAGIAHELDMVTKLSYMMPDTLRPYLTQAGYYTPILSRLGVPDDQTLVLGAFLDRMGLGRGKGGTSVQNFVQAMMKPLSLTGHHQAGQIAALETLGIYSHGKENAAIFRTDPKTGNSVIDVVAALETIQKSIDEQTRNLKGDAKARKERELVGDFQKAFGIQGQRFGLLGDDKGIEQILGMFDQLKRMPSINQMQNRYMQNMDSQAVRAWSNFQSLMTELGTLAIPGVTKGLTDMGDAFHAAQGWLHKHGDLEKRIQHEIYTDVVGVEKYIVDHKQDWKDLAHYMGDAAQDAKDLTAALASLFGPFMYVLRYGKTVMKGMYDENGLSQSDFDALDPEGARYRAAQDHLRRDLRAAGRSIPPPKQPGPTVVNLHEGAIKIDAKGMTPDELTASLGLHLSNAVRDPRSFGARHGSVYTDPRTPSALNTPRFVR